MNKYILIILISFLSCSKQDKKTEIELMNCINNQYSDSIENFYGTKNKTSFYDLMLEVEEVLVKNELLRNTKKKSFLDFFSKLKDNNKKLALEKINKLLKESKFDMNYSNLYSIFQSCPYKIFQLNKNSDSILVKQYEVFSKMEIEGNDNLNLLHKLIDVTEDKSFNKIVYRAPIILLAVINMDYLVNGKKGPQNVKFD